MLPFDITSLLLFGGLLISIIAGEAAYSGDTLSLRINVSPKIVETGFDAATAEKIFLAQAGLDRSGPFDHPDADPAGEFASHRHQRTRDAAQSRQIDRRAAGPIRL